jgi:hypothetical protein
MLLEAPALFLGGALCELSGMNWSLFARGFMSGIAFVAYLVIVYVIVFRVVRWICAQFASPKKQGDSN